MACKREDRFRHNTIAFWLSDEEKAEVEAKIILSGVPKGEYYRKAVLEQEIKVVSGNYMSFRLSKVLEQICEELHNGNSENEQLLLALLKELIALQKNAPAGKRAANHKTGGGKLWTSYPQKWCCLLSIP